MKPSAEEWQVNRWPLVERGMTRRDCLRRLERHGYPEPPKSACIDCPFHFDAAWRQLRDDEPDAWTDAVAVDRAIRTGRRCRSTRRTCRTEPIRGSSTSGPTSARACVGSDHRPSRSSRGG
ncbi:hypothetical protein [Azospirillum sp. sgz301742]